jgi:hypothetical protein
MNYFKCVEILKQILVSLIIGFSVAPIGLRLPDTPLLESTYCTEQALLRFLPPAYCACLAISIFGPVLIGVYDSHTSKGGYHG